MALQISYEDAEGNTYTTAYARIGGIGLHLGVTEKRVEVSLAVYRDSDARQANKREVAAHEFAVPQAELAALVGDGSNVIARAYEWLKQRVPGPGELDLRNAIDV